MKLPTVSYVVPVYNGRHYLAQTLDSLLAQTHKLLEVIVIDDGSTDDSGELARSYGGVVRCVRQANAGQSAARNHGVRLAVGDFVGFLDADDLLQPIKVQHQIEAFAAEPGLDFCDAFTRNFWSPELKPEERDDDPKLLEPWPGHISTWLFRRSLFQEVGGFEEHVQFSEDTEWFLRVYDRGAKMRRLREVLAYRRLHNQNITRKQHDKHIEGILRLYKRRVDARKARARQAGEKPGP